MNYGAAAGSEAPVTEFGYLDGGPSPIWETIASFGLLGLLFVPLALLVVWLLHRLGWNRSWLVSATVAAFASVLVFGGIRFYNNLTLTEVDFAAAATWAFDWGEPAFHVLFVITWLGAFWLARRLHCRANPQIAIETFE